MMKLKLPGSISSPQDLEELLLEVRSYTRWHAHNAVREQAGAEASPQPPLSEAGEEVIRSWHGKKSPTAKTLDKLIQELEDLKDTAPRVAIILAAPPGPKLKSRLVTWCRKHLQAEVLVDFSFDSSLLGGMVVRCGSHIYDWSFRRQIIQNRDRFPEVLRRV